MKLTAIAIKNAKPKAKPYKLVDGGGLFLLISPTGGKLWRYRYAYLNKEKVLAIGQFPDISLAEARELHAQARKALALGTDPCGAKKEAKRKAILNSQMTFESVAREWYENFKHTWVTKYSSRMMTRLEQYVFPKIGSRPIAELTAPEILAVLRIVEEKGILDTVKRLRQACGQVFTYAIATGRAERNPVNDLKGALKPPVQKHQAYLKEHELPEFLKRLEAYDGAMQTQLALKFLLLTFVRTGELRGAEWSEVDFEKSEWRIPAERMKTRNIHIVPLSTQALKVLEQLQPITGQYKYIFPNQHRPQGMMSENTVLFALYRMGYHSKATGHGFRATASTILNENGFPPDVIERQLAHVEGNQVRAAYNHAQYLPERRKMLQWYGDYLDSVRRKSVEGISKTIPSKQSRSE
ncbi:MAG: tyrosine-type recombinase/integrase [Bacteroidota bacterium]